MNLRWNPAYSRFEAEFHDFQTDLEAVKAAGFKTTGAPEWIWFCLNTVPLQKLRENRPPSGLTINPDAKAEFEKRAEIDKRNAEVKAQLTVKKKELKTKIKADEQEGQKRKLEIPHKPGEDFDYIGKEDLPPSPPFESELPKPAPYTGPRCTICNDPTADWEYPEGAVPVCLWCQKIVLDNAVDVC